MSNRSSSELSLPRLSEESNQALSIESTLGELPLYHFQVDIEHLGIEVAQIFAKYPLLPGAVLVEQGQFLGMISRQRLLEYLIRPHGLELFLHQPLQTLYSYARTEMLLLPAATPIVIAARQALRRSPELRGEPIVVQVEAQSYQLLDVHELNIAYWQIRGIETQVRYERVQAQMIQSEKMASLGRLVDGVAHEILDPVGFIWGNLTYVSTYAQELMELVQAYEAHFLQLPEELINLKEEIELDFLQQDLPRTIESIRAGAERLKKLATGLQNFCHIDEVYPKPADLHTCIDGILLLLNSRLTTEIEVIKHYGSLPPVPCYIGQLSQVFMNILTNAIDALMNRAIGQELALEFGGTETTSASLHAAEKPRIEITTQVYSPKVNNHPNQPDARWVSIRIANNGPNLSPELHHQILESFSTEQRAAKETSLAVSYRIVTAKHGGKLILRSRSTSAKELRQISAEDLQLHTGTEFEILLPLV